MSKEDNHLFVVAIDFGTTYSGYAFSARGDFSSDPLENIETNIWQSGNLVSHKTPTTLLLKHGEPDGRQEFVAFGYEAEDLYSHLAEGERDGYYYFRRFKMALSDEDRTVVGGLVCLLKVNKLYTIPLGTDFRFCLLNYMNLVRYWLTEAIGRGQPIYDQVCYLGNYE